MKKVVENIFENLFRYYPEMVSCRNSIEAALEILKECLKRYKDCPVNGSKNNRTNVRNRWNYEGTL